MRVISHDFFGVNTKDIFRLTPLGDIHLGARACAEDRFIQTVRRIAEDPNHYWLSLGDVADFINIRDPRFSPGSLADWLKVVDLADLARAQANRFLNIVKPITPRCLGCVMGNHEMSIHRFCERAIHSEIVNGIKELGGKEETYLDLGYNGWVLLNFYHSPEGKKRAGRHQIKIYCHHGFGGGKLAGAKALNLEKVLWTRGADIVIMGHVHGMQTDIKPVYEVKGKKAVVTYRFGAWSGTFLQTHSDNGDTYAEVKGYFPTAIGGVEFQLRPMMKRYEDRIKMISELR